MYQSGKNSLVDISRSKSSSTDEDSSAVCLPELCLGRVSTGTHDLGPKSAASQLL